MRATLLSLTPTSSPKQRPLFPPISSSVAPATHLLPRHQQPSATFAMWAPLLPSSHPIKPRPNEPAPATRFYTLHSTLTLPAPELQSVGPCILLPFPLPLIFSSSSIVFLCFSHVLTPFLLHFTLHSRRPPMHVDGRSRGESKPTVTQLPPGTSASKSTAMATRI